MGVSPNGAEAPSFERSHGGKLAIVTVRGHIPLPFFSCRRRPQL